MLKLESLTQRSLRTFSLAHRDLLSRLRYLYQNMETIWTLLFAALSVRVSNQLLSPGAPSVSHPAPSLDSVAPSLAAWTRGWSVITRCVYSANTGNICHGLHRTHARQGTIIVWDLCLLLLSFTDSVKVERWAYKRKGGINCHCNIWASKACHVSSAACCVTAPPGLI